MIYVNNRKLEPGIVWGGGLNVEKGTFFFFVEVAVPGKKDASPRST